LFRVDRTVITKHIRNILLINGLDEDSVCAKIAHTARDGKIYETLYYNLDAIISVGYRVNSARATQFLIWATSILKKHLIEGYTLNEERLKKAEAQYQELQRAVSPVVPAGTKAARYKITYENARGIIDTLKSKFAGSALVG
jgi:prophage maintenance system killer protein